MDLREKLKNIPSGTVLYSLVSGRVTFKEIRDRIIVVLDCNHCEQLYHLTGRLYNSGMSGECLLFPSVDNRDWDTFCPFKKGDIVVSGGGCIAIVDHVGEFGSYNDVIHYQCCLDSYGDLIIKTDVGIGHACDCKYAPTYDQERILKKLHEQGYVLDGDTVIKKRFDPKSFEGYQKVLVRSTPSAHWRCTFFSHMINGIAMCSSDNWPYCIPYKGNEHLRGKTDDCDDFYKWWENK